MLLTASWCQSTSTIGTFFLIGSWSSSIQTPMFKCTRTRNRWIQKKLGSLPGKVMQSLRTTVYSKLKLKPVRSEILERFAKPKNGCHSIDLATAETVSFAKEKGLASSWSLLKTFISILEIFWLIISSWTRRKGNISRVFASLALLNSLRALQNSLMFLNKSEHNYAEKSNDALVGMVMAQRQISVA